jgi:hypothetical protein
MIGLTYQINCCIHVAVVKDLKGKIYGLKFKAKSKEQIWQYLSFNGYEYPYTKNIIDIRDWTLPKVKHLK